MRPVPEREAAKAAGERFYFTGKPCRNGHLSKRSTATGICCACASVNSIKSAAKRPWHPARIEAKAAGLKTYDTGEPCQNGHTAPRYTCNGICVECDAMNIRAYRAKRPGLEAKWARERRAKDPSGHREASSRWYHSNKAAAREICQRWKAANPDRLRELSKIGVNRRRARVAGNGGSFTAADIEALFNHQAGRCAACGSEDRLEIDHILPIVLGGSSDPSNLQLLCLPCNRSKGRKHPDDWSRERKA